MESNSNQLLLAKCENCNKLFSMPVYICSKCGNQEFGRVISSGKGRVLSYTTIRVPPWVSWIKPLMKLV